jgi:glycosyltransferase involved in cell wall biosynthesis
LYSGSFGLAHSYEEFLDLGRRLRGSGAALCFAGRGHRADELRRAATAADDNIRFAGFAPETELERRLAACDLHLVSLRPEWTGTVVPSKFFGALAAGRGVVFAGSPESGIAQWIREHRVGWVLTPETIDATAAELRDLAVHPERLAALRDRCPQVYDEHFSRRAMIDRWDALLRAAVGLPPAGADDPTPSREAFSATSAASGGAKWDAPAGVAP